MSSSTASGGAATSLIPLGCPVGAHFSSPLHTEPWADAPISAHVGAGAPTSTRLRPSDQPDRRQCRTLAPNAAGGLPDLHYLPLRRVLYTGKMGSVACQGTGQQSIECPTNPSPAAQ